MLKLGLGTNKVNNAVFGGVPEIELISHWIGDNVSTGSIPNEVGGKPALTVTNENDNIHWTGHNSWEQSTAAQNPNKVVGTIFASAIDYSMVFALHTGSGWSGSVYQRLMGASNGSAVRFIDLLAWNQIEPTWSFWDATGSNSHLLAADLEPDVTNTIFTLIFEDPDIIIYKNGALLGTLVNAYTKNSLDGTIAFLSRDDGGSRGYLASSMAEMKIFSGVIGDSQRISEENAMASTYNITF